MEATYFAPLTNVLDMNVIGYLDPDLRDTSGQQATIEANQLLTVPTVIPSPTVLAGKLVRVTVTVRATGTSAVCLLEIHTHSV